MLVVTTTAVPGRRIMRHRFGDLWLRGASAGSTVVLE